MLILGIESTCDETGFALVRDGKEILANCIASQIDRHAKHGGVIPELASRLHVDACLPLLQKALNEAGCTLSDVDLISVAKGPGLIGALLVGVNFAKGLSLALNKPLIGVNHVEAHLYAPLMEQSVPLPALGIVLSGGHTLLALIEEIGSYRVIGQTQDDALGEAFDKVGSLLGLDYPGGPAIERLAVHGDAFRFPLKAGQIKQRPYDFSFSGLKTGVLYLVKGQNGNKEDLSVLPSLALQDVAASFQQAAFEDVIQKALLAAREFGCRSLIFGGGVCQNQTLRRLFEKLSPLPLFWPPAGLCLDNAAMIAGLGYAIYAKTKRDCGLDLDVQPRISL